MPYLVLVCYRIQRFSHPLLLVNLAVGSVLRLRGDEGSPTLSTLKLFNVTFCHTIMLGCESFQTLCLVSSIWGVSPPTNMRGPSNLVLLICLEQRYLLIRQVFTNVFAELHYGGMGRLFIFTWNITAVSSNSEPPHYFTHNSILGRWSIKYFIRPYLSRSTCPSTTVSHFVAPSPILM